MIKTIAVLTALAFGPLVPVAAPAATTQAQLEERVAQPPPVTTATEAAVLVAPAPGSDLAPLGIPASTWIKLLGVLFMVVIALLSALVWKASARDKKLQMLGWMDWAYYAGTEFAAKTPNIIDDLVAAGIGELREVLARDLGIQLNQKQLTGLALLSQKVKVTQQVAREAVDRWTAISGAAKEEAKTRALAVELATPKPQTPVDNGPTATRGLSGKPWDRP